MKNFFKIVFSLFLLFSVASFATTFENKDNDVGIEKTKTIRSVMSDQILFLNVDIIQHNHDCEYLNHNNILYENSTKIFKRYELEVVDLNLSYIHKSKQNSTLFKTKKIKPDRIIPINNVESLFLRYNSYHIKLDYIFHNT